MDSERPSSELGEETMPMINQASFSELTLRQQGSLLKVYQEARRSFLRRRSSLTQETIGESEVNAILEHYYVPRDDDGTNRVLTTNRVVRTQASVEGPYFGREESDSSMEVLGSKLFLSF